MTAGRARITDLIDADAGSPRYCGHSIGRVLAVDRDGETQYLHVQRIERSGESVYGVGTVVSGAQAVKLQTCWDIRWGFRCAPQPAVGTAEHRAGAGDSTRHRSRRFADIDAAASAIVSTGYRELAKSCHPDTGGDHQTMSLLTQAKSQLSKILALALAKGNAV